MLKTWLLSTVAIMAGAPAFAQAPPTNSAAAVDEVVVTGSRIVRNGYQAPSPVTVVTTEALEKTAPASIPDGLNQLPQFSGSRSASTTGVTGATPASGNYLNLRGIGIIRNLVMLDGQRIPPTNFDGTVDTNVLPQMLVQRVDVVTGGASAAYGSDAVSGVINFVLDTKFNGFKGVVQGGISDFRDDGSYKVGLAYGGNITDRLHVLFSAEHYGRQGVPDQANRPRGGDSCSVLGAGNGTAANPLRAYCFTGHVAGTLGTLLTFPTPVTVIPGQPASNRFQFLPGTIVATYNPGQSTGNPTYNYGGDGAPLTGHSLTSKIITDQLFARFDYALTPDVNVFAQMTWAESFNRYTTFRGGTQLNDFRIFADNAYLPTVVANAIQASGQIYAPTGQRFVTGGRITDDFTPKTVNTLNDAYTFLSGFNGKVGDYSWKATYAHGDSLVRFNHYGNVLAREWFGALDAVKNARGETVCRITITNPGLQDDCVPINIFGVGSPSKAADDYVNGDSQYQIRNKMDIVAGEFSGELFTLPAGTVAFAVGAEARKQSLVQTTNSDPAAPIDITGLRTNVNTFLFRTLSTNNGKANGSYNVKEAFFELDVPLLRDMPLARSLSVNAAGRYTDYSTSGGVKTWKVGLSYQPIEDLRIRYTRSRDIRAPTLYEFFAGTTGQRAIFNDVHTNTGGNLLTTSQGNPNLTPEIGDTYTVGLVYQPSWIEGLSGSIDYYNIEISDVISNISVAQSNQECEDSNGTSPLCANIVRPLPFSNRTAANYPSTGTFGNINQALAYYHGIDWEVSYRFPLSRIFDTDARLDLRMIGGYNPTRKTKANAGAAPNQTANTGVTPKLRYNLIGNYTNGRLNVNLQARYIGKTVRTRNPAIFFEQPENPSWVYFDTTIGYKFEIDGKQMEAFLTVNDLFDKQAPFLPVAIQPGGSYPTVIGLFDPIGRYYTTGLRFKF